MVNGPLGRKIFHFALPVALTGMLQQLFNAADVAVVGQFASKYAMAAVGSNSPLINLLVTLFVGISLGGNVMIARFIGQGDPERAERAVHTAVVTAVLSGLLVTALGEAIAAPMLRLMGVPEEVFPMALIYLRIYLAGMPFILLYDFESAIFRSQGNTRTPLNCLVIAGVLNVLLNLLFVIGFHMDADGVALATVLSNVISSGLMFRLLLKGKGTIKLEWRKLRIDRAILRDMMKIGVPSGVQGMMFSLSNIIIQSAINSLGADVMAASSAAFNIEIFAYYLVNGFGQATTTFVSQNYGAGKPERCRKATQIAFWQDMGVTALFMAVTIGFAPYFIRIFNSDATVIALGVIRIRYIVGGELINVFMEIFSGAMRGYGKSLAPAVISLFGVCVIRIVYVYTYFRVHHTWTDLMRIYPISWAVTAAALVIAYVFLIRKMRKGSSVPPAEQDAVTETV